MPAAAPLNFTRPRSVSWLTDPVTYRACDLCVHGLTVGTMRHCTNPKAVQPRRSIPVDQTRGHGGACGPDGALLQLPAEVAA